MGAFDNLEKNVKEEDKKVVSEIKQLKTEFKPDWEKISKLVLTILKPELPPATYNMLVVATSALLKKRSIFSKVVSFVVIASVQIAGIYELIHLILSI